MVESAPLRRIVHLEDLVRQEVESEEYNAQLHAFDRNHNFAIITYWDRVDTTRVVYEHETFLGEVRPRQVSGFILGHVNGISQDNIFINHSGVSGKEESIHSESLSFRKDSLVVEFETSGIQAEVDFDKIRGLTDIYIYNPLSIEERSIIHLGRAKTSSSVTFIQNDWRLNLGESGESYFLSRPSNKNLRIKLPAKIDISALREQWVGDLAENPLQPFSDRDQALLECDDLLTPLGITFE